MKKVLLSISLLLLTSIMTFGQSPFSMSWNGVEIPDNGAMYLMGDPADAEVVAYVIVKNNKTDLVSMKVRRVEKQVAAGTWNQLCWNGICYAPSVSESQYAILGAGESTAPDSFSAHYAPSGVYGTSVIDYVFYNSANESEKITLTVYFSAFGASVEDLMSRSSFSNAYPNPANQRVSFDYNFPVDVKTASVKVFNMLGKVVLEQVITDRSGKVQLSLNELTDGVYFYTLVLNNQAAKTQKLVVQK
ncbi:MAG: T9SS type A sorting domain-containing protein [Bacteroidetes bacterium]|nr:T9SS type A sorting domain-containing protein [Bacteroidota bacterium]